MQESDVLAALAPVFGVALQWLRQYRWFNDGLTILVALIGGGIAAWLVLERLDPKAFVFRSFVFAPAILGGTMLAQMASHQVTVVPKWNSATKGGEG